MFMMRMSRITRSTGAAFAGLVLGGSPSAFAQDAAPASAAATPSPAKASAKELTADQRAKNLASFDVVWTTIRDTHYDASLGGVDWQKAKDDLRPQVEAATTMAAARKAISDVIDRLKLSHFGIIPAEVYNSVDAGKGGPGEVGINVREVGGQAIVSAVLADSPAAKAGVKPGWVVVRVGDKTTREVFDDVAKAYTQPSLQPAYKVMTLVGHMNGPIGETLAIDFLDAADQPIHMEIPREAPQGVAAKFGNLPTIHVRYESRRVQDTIGYVALNTFFDPARVLKLYGESIKSLKDAEGLIIDLRGNPGGVGAMAIGMGSWLVTEPNQKLGTMLTRDSSVHFSLNPRAIPFEKPVAVLVDELSMSTSEILAAGLKDLKRARVFGTKTPGAALPSRFDVLPNGDRFQYAFANYISSGGKPLEGVGVSPDVDVPLSRKSLVEGRDDAVEAAASWIHAEHAKRTPQ